MELKFTKAVIKRLFDGAYELTLTISRDYAAELEKFKGDFTEGTLWDAVIKKHRERRSLDANAYCWVLLRRLAEKLQDITPDGKTKTKEEIYRDHIRDVGVFEPLPIREDAVERFCAAWAAKGVGWFVDIIDDSKLPGYKRVHAYYGSSTYNTAEMSRLIDNIVQDCKALGVETLPPQELQRLKEEW